MDLSKSDTSIAPMYASLTFTNAKRNTLSTGANGTGTLGANRSASVDVVGNHRYQPTYEPCEYAEISPEVPKKHGDELYELVLIDEERNGEPQKDTTTIGRIRPPGSFWPTVDFTSISERKKKLASNSYNDKNRANKKKSWMYTCCLGIICAFIICLLALPAGWFIIDFAKGFLAVTTTSDIPTSGDRNKACGDQFTHSMGMHLEGATLKNEIATLAQCKEFCVQRKRPPCFGLDWNNGTHKCWIHSIAYNKTHLKPTLDNVDNYLLC